jgi:NADPH:quinone reductase-like Zn-dependent oxidoreductase
LPDLFGVKPPAREPLSLGRTLADFDGSKEHGVRFSNGFVDGHAFHAFAEVGELIEAGRFWLPVDKTFSLAAIAESHRISEHGRVRGRLVLVVV